MMAGAAVVINGNDATQFGVNLNWFLSRSHGAKKATAKAAGLSMTSLYFILIGKSMPSLTTALDLARVTNVPLDDLMLPHKRFTVKYANRKPEILD